MSKESAVAFLERLKGDEVLAERLRGCTVPEAEKLVKGELGYDFTKEEMQQVIFEKKPELTDEDLERVVGGDLGFLAGAIIGMSIGGGIGVGGLVIVAAAAA